MTALTMYCTGRGRHRRRDLYVLDAAGPDLQLVRLVYGPTPAADNDSEIVDTVHRGYSGIGVELAEDRNTVLRCPSCTRAPTMTRHTLRKLYDGLTAAGVSEVDVSALPF